MGTSDFRLLVMHSDIRSMILYYDTELELRLASELLNKGLRVQFLLVGERYESGIWIDLFRMERR